MLGLAVTATVGGSCDSGGPVSAGEVPSGTVTGQVTVDGAGRAGVTVPLRIGTTTIATTQTGSGGTYAFANVVTEAKTVAITPPSSVYTIMAMPMRTMHHLSGSPESSESTRAAAWSRMPSPSVR